MAQLLKDTYAVQIHGKSKQEVATCTLPAGTCYGKVSYRYDALGFVWKRIKVRGYLYEIAE